MNYENIIFISAYSINKYKSAQTRYLPKYAELSDVIKGFQ